MNSHTDDANVVTTIHNIIEEKEDTFSFFSSEFQKDNDNNNSNHDNGNYHASDDEGEIDLECVVAVDESKLSTVLSRLQQQSSPMILGIQEMNYRQNLIVRHMGTMAQCRRIDLESAVDACLFLLHSLRESFLNNHHRMSSVLERRGVVVALELAATCLAALRDLTCGNAAHRNAIFRYSFHSTTTSDGIFIIAAYLHRNYDTCLWEEMSRLELSVLTNVTAVIRNATHSNKCNSEAFHTCIIRGTSVTDMLIGRLKQQPQPQNEDGNHTFRLPNVSKPWREACYRMAGSLINMSEKCNECAERCGRDDDLIYLLLDSWGGFKKTRTKQTATSAPLLHLGLMAILRVAHTRLNGPYCSKESVVVVRDGRTFHDEHRFDNELKRIIESMLREEEERKGTAQRFEMERLAKKLSSHS